MVCGTYKRKLDECSQALTASHRPGAPAPGLRGKAHHAPVM
jgi:hypothetical protein